MFQGGDVSNREEIPREPGYSLLVVVVVAFFFLPVTAKSASGLLEVFSGTHVLNFLS